MAAALALAAPAAAGGVGLPISSAGPVIPGPPNGDLALGLEGWTVLGRGAQVAPRPSGGQTVTLRENTSLVSPPFTVPADGQVLSVAARAPRGGAVLEVRARPEDGAPEVALGAIVPTARLTRFRVPLPGLAGRPIRIVLDPVAALGRSIELIGVGPLEGPLPGWTLRSGLPSVARSAGRLAVVATDTRLEVVSPTFAPPPFTRFLLVAVRGDGRLLADAGGGPVTARAGAGWRDLRVPLPAGATQAAVSLRADPGEAGLAMSDLAEPVTQVRLSRVRVVRRGRVALVTAQAGAGAAGLAAELQGGGRALGRGRVAADGGMRLSAPATGRAALLVVAGDRTRLAARTGVRLPVPPKPRRPPARAR